MSVSQLGAVRLPPAVAWWIDGAILVFLVLFVLWVVLKAIGFALRRSYNLTPVATARSKDIRPDFLKVDHAAQEEMIERGGAFDGPAVPAARAARLAGIGVVASGVVSFVSATFLAFGRIEELDTTWRNLSAKDKFAAIIQSHPFGFAIATAMVLAALVRLTMTIRKGKQ
jgi:hypothetical protein